MTCSTWVQSQKQQNDVHSFPKQTFQYHSNLSLCPNHNTEEAEVQWLWRPTRPPRTKTSKRCPFHQRGLECKSRKSRDTWRKKKKKRDTWSNGQVWLWSRKWNRAKTNRVLPRELTVHSKHPLPTKHKRWLYTWTSPDGQYQNQIDCILCSWRWRSSIQSAKIRPGADCGSDHQLLIAKFKLKLKKVGKTTRPLRYDLNQIPYNYTVRWCIWLYRGDE